MKKLFFIFTVLFSLVSNLFAQSAPKASSYDIFVMSSQNNYRADNSTSTRDNHGGNVWIAVLVKGYASYLVTTFNNQQLPIYTIDPIDLNNDSFIGCQTNYYNGLFF